MNGWRRALVFLAAFAFVALCGGFIGLAGGVQWGTADAGLLAFVSVVVGIVAGHGAASSTNN